MMLRPAAPRVWLFVAMTGMACDGAPAADPADRAAAVAPQPAPTAAPAAPATSTPVPAARRIVILGDSLTAGLGLPADQAYPALLQTRLDARSAGWQVVNAGVSGDTSAGGLRRLDWSLDGGAAIVVIALGGNDALRGLPAADLARNLDAAVQQAQAAGARVILAGMEAPPNTGPEYTRAFRAVYPAIASSRGATLVPFLLDGVAGIETLNQADGIHPNQAGARLVADTVWRVLEPVVRDLEATPTR
jgi:acyl-CoA thioesterase-1